MNFQNRHPRLNTTTGQGHKKNYKIADHSFTVPDSGVVPVQVDIPGNATSISLHVSYMYCDRIVVGFTTTYAISAYHH
jgi:hypothetical protein